MESTIIAVLASVITGLGTYILPKAIEFFRERSVQKLAKQKQDAEIQQTDAKIALEFYKNLIIDQNSKIAYLSDRMLKDDEERIHLRAENARLVEENLKLKAAKLEVKN